MPELNGKVIILCLRSGMWDVEYCTIFSFLFFNLSPLPNFSILNINYFCNN